MHRVYRRGVDELPEAALDVVVVGGGPRAVSVVERLAARRDLEVTGARGDGARGYGPVRVALVDAVEPGAGATWRTDQSGLLLNNTYAGHTTTYPDASTPMAGPVVTGPDLLAWARSPAPAGRPGWVGEEVARLQPWSFPSRRLQGVYYGEQVDRASGTGLVEVVRVSGVVVDVSSRDDVREVRLADGRRLLARTVVLAQGMVQSRRSASTRAFAAHAAAADLVYVEPGMPAERDLSVVPAGEPVLVLGLGATFFDVLALLTLGRGGRVEPLDGTAGTTDPSVRTTDGCARSTGGSQPRLRYLPGGAEPLLLVGSRRGLPYRSKAAYPDGFPPAYEPDLATPAWFASVATTQLQDFRADVWPQLARELVWAHLRTVLEHHPGAVRAGTTAGPLLASVAATTAGDLDDLVADVVTDPRHHLRVDRLDRPDADVPLSEQQWQAWLLGWVEAEHASLAHPATSPRNAVNRAMAALRGPAKALVGQGAVAGRSVVGDVHGWFDALGLSLASGPPPDRSALLHALLRAGVVRLLGEGTAVTAEPGAFVARSTGVRRDPVRARVLLETRMSKGRVDTTDDPLLRSLLATGRARLHRWPDPDGSTSTDTSLDVDLDAFRLVDAAGTADDAMVVLGIPAEGLQPGSAIGASPGVPSPLIAGADIAAAHVLHRRATWR